MLWGSMWTGIQFQKQGPASVLILDALQYASCDDKTTVYNELGLDLNNQPAVRVFFVRESRRNTQTGTNLNGEPIIRQESALGWTCPGAADIWNNIFISTSHANSTTLAHEFGHTLSLWETGSTITPSCSSGASPCPPPNQIPEPWVADPDGVYPTVSTTNLMWSGSMNRDKITKGQGFRANVNSLSAVYRHHLQHRPLNDSPRDCPDEVPTNLRNICPAIYVDK